MASTAPGPRPQRILVADPDPRAAAECEEALREPGRQLARATTGRQLVDLCRTDPPDLIVSAPSLLDGPALALLAEATGGRRVPVVLVTSDVAGDLAGGAGELAVEALLTKPVKAAALRAAVAVAAARFAREEALRAEVAGLRQQLDERKLVERAKGVVCRRLGVPEEDAYRRMRKLSSDLNRKLVEVARRILDCDEVFGELERARG